MPTNRKLFKRRGAAADERDPTKLYYASPTAENTWELGDQDALYWFEDLLGFYDGTAPVAEVKRAQRAAFSTTYLRAVMPQLDRFRVSKEVPVLPQPGNTLPAILEFFFKKIGRAHV